MGINYSHALHSSGRGAWPAAPPLPELAPVLLEKRRLRR
jgi:hypothetical protein